MMSSDGNYIKYKIQLLKTHAQKLLTHHVNSTDDDYENLTAKEREIMEDR